MTRPRSILIVSPWVPTPTSGFGTRVFQLCSELARDHRVEVLCHATPDDAGAITALRERVTAVHTFATAAPSTARKRLGQAASLLSPRPFESRRQTSRAMQAALDGLLARESFDVAQLESAHLGGLRIRGVPVLLDEHNIEHELLDRLARAHGASARGAYYRWDATRMRRLELGLWRRIAACAVTSERELDIMRARCPSLLGAVVRNGVDTDHFRPDPLIARRRDRVVFVGTMHYQPNADAAIDFIHTVVPRLRESHPDVVFSVVGHGAPRELTRLAGPHVVVTGSVPDVRPHLLGASVVVAPLRSGSGTRLKILEAMAAGCAVVSTRIGAEGIDAVDGEHLLIADEPHDLALQVGRLLSDDALRDRLGESGRALAVASYGWRAAAEALDDLQEHAVSAHRGAPALAMTA